MNHGTTASLICPACGQAFLTMQHAMEGMAQCPHCAHTAPRAHFGTQSQVAGVAQVRRRVSQAPAQPRPPVEQAWTPPPAPAQQAHFHPLSHATAAAPSPPMSWQPAAAPAITRTALQPSQALMPLHTPPPPVDFTATPPQLQPSSGRRGVLVLAVALVCGIGLWMWWDHAHAPLPTSAESTAGTGKATEIRRAQLPIPPPPPPVKVEMQDTAAFAADAKSLVTAFFAATTPEARADCVHDAVKHGAEIEALFGPAAPAKIELRQLAQLPIVLLSLPGAQHVPLFKLITSHCPGGALLRLETGPDGRRRIFWPLLVETHEGRLPAFLQQQQRPGPEAEAETGADAAWFHVALRPSHGLDLPAALRPKYLTFDVQTAAASEPHLVACVERDTPLGRFMDRDSEWGRVYLARLLVRKLSIEAGAPCMTVVDCEGAVER